MRPRKCRCLRHTPRARFYKPQGIPLRELETLILRNDEMEALLLSDFKGMEQEEAAKLMGISRPTFSRTLSAARQIIAQALAKGCAIQIGEEEKA